MTQLLRHPQPALKTGIDKLMIHHTALSTVVRLHHQTVLYIFRNPLVYWTIDCLCINTDERVTFDAIAYCDKIDIFATSDSTDVTVVFKNEFIKIPNQFQCKSTTDIQMDLVFSPQNQRHVVLFFSPTEQLVYVHKTHSGEVTRYSTYPHVLHTHYWLSGEQGEFFSSSPNLTIDTGLWSETIFDVNYLYNIGRWAVQTSDVCFVLDEEGMSQLMREKNKTKLIYAIDTGRLNCMYANFTSPELRFTDDHGIMFYIFKQRICLARTVYPFFMAPNTKIGIPRDVFDPVIRIRYFQSEHVLQIICMKQIYTFNMFARSLTDSTSNATTFE